LAVKSALVTGSSSGIGKAITALLLQNGIKVIGLARDHSKFTPQQSNYCPIAVDLSDIVNLEKKIQSILQNHPEISIFISNAGYGDFRHIENFSTPQIQEFLNLNLISQIILCRNFTSHFKRDGSGDIIILGSEAALAGKRKSTLYSAAKFGLRGFAQSLRDEVGASGIRVCLINPGLVRSPFFDNLDFEPGDFENNAIAPDDIAKIVLELLNTRNGTIIDEINLSPASNSINFKRRN
jgi:short-subunit dehydrogenase